MLVIRPIRESDYASLYQIACESGIGFTSLPVNEELLRSKITRAVRSFSRRAHKPGAESYLMVMEDTESGDVVGTCGIEACVGLTDAFYHYHVGQVVHSSRELKIHNMVETLTLCNDYTGAAELCTLFLRESHRKGLAGRLLSRSRMLLMAEHPELFGAPVIAEMRGVSDEHGCSPFWQWLEQHFFSMDFPTADYLTGIGQKVFIAELMPKYPIYVNLLSKAAQEVIGRVHEKTQPALQLLKTEGFRCKGYVDIFDAGPTVEAELSQIRSVRSSQRRHALLAEVDKGSLYMIANTQLAQYRCTLVEAVLDDETGAIVISPEVADVLCVKQGDPLRVLAVK
ncbi:arginine N-succinyltransferase [Corallincola luteus]|uniref:Arginine N-succinyltransferase n=1 Tax=Corallincola luteus TaxID=1775177 RepID=A0ABY2AMV3_9GAMM|nr:arginine N-succinyltransferase [Corallincola luteus]TCI04534.1 arginine N-succinyltransferase [Corallincola luteus]